MQLVMITLLTTLLLFTNEAGLLAEPAHLIAGPVRTGPALVKQFTLKNTTSGEVELITAESGCGCAKPTLERMLLKAGESTTLTMSVNTLTQPAGVSTWKTAVRYRRVEVIPSIKPHDALEVKLTAELIREVALTPPQLAISTESTAKQVVKLTDVRPTPLKVEKVISSHPSLKVKLLPAQIGPPFEQSFELELDESYPVRAHTESILLITNDPTCRELVMPVQVQKRPKTAFKVSPEEVLFTFTDKQLSESRLVQIRHSQGEMLQIESVVSSSNGPQVKWSTDAGLVVTVRISGSVTDPQFAPNGLAQIQVKLRSHPGQVVLVPITWRDQRTP
jgi:hypothetical protein